MRQRDKFLIKYFDSISMMIVLFNDFAWFNGKLSLQQNEKNEK